MHARASVSERTVRNDGLCGSINMVLRGDIRCRASCGDVPGEAFAVLSGGLLESCEPRERRDTVGGVEPEEGGLRGELKATQ